MLKRIRSRLPSSVFEKERFVIPKALGHIEGNKTIISNFKKIAEALQRPEEHFLKFILRELATPGQMRQNELILGTKVSANRINEKIRQYAEEFVLCHKCGKPDTKLIKEGELTSLRCFACGHKNMVRSKI